MTLPEQPATTSPEELAVDELVSLEESRDALSPALGKLAASAARAGAKGLSELF